MLTSCSLLLPSSWIEKGVLGLNGVIGCFGMTEVRLCCTCRR
jgi:hypothetical protein